MRRPRTGERAVADGVAGSFVVRRIERRVVHEE
jgi:hypothetical protein